MLQVEPIEEIMAEADYICLEETHPRLNRALIKHAHAERSALPGIMNTTTS